MATKPISSEAVRKATGETLETWFARLKKAGAMKWPHKEIASWLSEKQGVGPWWCQMLTVEFERAHGLREVNQKCDGSYSATASRTLPVTLEALYQAWHDPKQRRQWLSVADVTLRTATANKSMRLTWEDGMSIVCVNFYSKGPAKAQVTIEHNKLKNAASVMRMKAYWAEIMEELKEFLTHPSA
jgi:hypothetical protein